MEILELLDIDKNNIHNYKMILKRSKKEKLNLSIGADNFDKILGGGLKSGSVYLFFGSNSSGKTQLCHQICIKAHQYFTKIYKKKNQKFILYFDTENTFRPERIKELSEFYNVNYKSVLKNILVSKISSNSILLLSLKNLEEIFDKNSTGLFLIDSINHHYRFEKGEKNLSFDKTKRNFLKILEKINKITIKLNLITIITAQITPNFINDAFVKEIPVAIQYLNHFFTEMIYLNHKQDNKCYAHLLNSQRYPEKRILYEITNEGIKDFKI